MPNNERPYSFSGWATKTGVKCSDGRTIAEDAFADGIARKRKVPLVWAHEHKDPTAVLGHAILENRPGGVYAYCYLNDTENAKHVQTCLENGDLDALSIWANKLKHDNKKTVLHGEIQELSVVLAGANRAALIDNVIMHDGIGEDDEGTVYIYSPTGDIEINDNGEIYHSDNASENSKSGKEDPEMPTDTKDNKEPAEKNLTAEEIKEIINGMTDDQRRVLYGMVGMAATAAKNSEGDEEMPKTVQHNLFEGDDNSNVDIAYLAHDMLEPIMSDMKRLGSLKEAYLAHADELAEYGIDSIDYLFPEHQDVNGMEPQFIKRADGWVTKVLNGVHRTPFAKVRMMFADITEDEARAKGYTKGKLKKEEVFGLLKRVIDPCTVYKKQKLNKDDLRDIKSFNVVMWIKKEMRMMLNEEIARAVVFGDGRSAISDDKINENNIIPIIKDTRGDFYAMKVAVTPGEGESVAHAVITAAVKGQDDYEGSGNLTFFTSPAMISDMLLMEDGFGHRLYKDIKDVALALGVSEIAKVPKTIIAQAGGNTNGFYGVIVDLKDYNIGADNGGEIEFFDDFDIDYNQEKYLMETRASGGLTRYHSALVLGSAEFLATLPGNE